MQPAASTDEDGNDANHDDLALEVKTKLEDVEYEFPTEIQQPVENKAKTEN